MFFSKLWCSDPGKIKTKTYILVYHFKLLLYCNHNGRSRPFPTSIPSNCRMPLFIICSPICHENHSSVLTLKQSNWWPYDTSLCLTLFSRTLEIRSQHPPSDSDNISETFMQSKFRHKIVNLEKKTGKKESLQLQQQWCQKRQSWLHVNSTPQHPQ